MDCYASALIHYFGGKLNADTKRYISSNNVYGDTVSLQLPSLEQSDFPVTAIIENYLGNYIGVMPPPKFRAENEIGLIYSKSAHLYEVKYVTFQFENRKITNLKLSEK